jgi:hypothetical protein
MRFAVSLTGPALVLLLAANAAVAQTSPPSPRVACRSSAMSLCHDEVKSGARTAIRACLIKNFDKVTPECQASMKAAQARGGADAQPDAAAPPKP